MTASVLACGAALAQGSGQIATVAGSGNISGAAASVAVGSTVGVATNALGNVYFTSNRNQVFRVDAQGNLTTVAGNASTGYTGDGGPATSASFDYFLTGIGAGNLAVDSAGNLYIADSDNQVVRRVDAATGTITTVAGNGIQGPSGEGGPATSASLNYPNSVAVDAAGNLFIGQAGSRAEIVERVDANTGIITVAAGTVGSTGYSGDGGPATSAQLDGGFSLEVAADGKGNLYIGDSMNCVIRAVNLQASPITVATRQIQAGDIATIAGNGTCGSSGDGGPATSAELSGNRLGVAVDSGGNIFIAVGSAIRRVDADSGIITQFAGTASGLKSPLAVAVDAQGNLFVASTSSVNGNAISAQIQRIDGVSGAVTTLAGGTGLGDGGPATSAELWLHSTFTAVGSGVAVDGSGDVFIADSANDLVRRVDGGTGIITTVAGNGIIGTSGDGGPATSAELNYPGGIALDSAGNLYIADFGNGSVRRVDAATGAMSRVAGSTLGMDGAACRSGDGGPATSAGAVSAYDVALDSAGNLFIAGGSSNCIGRVDATTGVLTTVAGGGGPAGFSGDGGPATSATMNLPTGIAVDSAGDLFIADLLNGRIRRVDGGSGIITTVAGGGSGGVGGLATNASLPRPTGVAVSAAGNLFIADFLLEQVLRVDHVSGIITVVAGNGTGEFSGDGGSAAAAGLDFPTKLALNGDDLYIGDTWNNRARKIQLPGYAVLSSTSVTFASQALNTPSGAQTVTVTNSGDMALAVMSVAASGDFSETDNCAPGQALGASCTISIVFTPTVAGTRNGTITITDNAADSPETISLNGTGTGAGITLSTDQLMFASQLLGTTSAAGSVMVMNSGTQPLGFTSIAATGDFAVTPGADMCSTSAMLSMGASCTIYVTFTPTAAGNRTGSLTLTDNAASSPQTVSLSGTGTPPSLSVAANVNFGGQLVNTTSAAVSVTVTNNGTAFPVAFTSIEAAGDFAVASGTTCSTSAPVSAGGNCAINLTFTPTATGMRLGSLTLTDGASNSPQVVNLSGTGTQPAFAASVGQVTFAAQLVGTTSGSQTVTVSNGGTGNLIFGSIAASGPFAIASAGTRCSSSTQVQPGSNCTVAVVFMPSATGAASGSLTFSDNAPGSPHSITLSGSGQDFSISPPAGSPTSMTVSPGQPATFMLTAGSEGGLTGTVSFSVTGAPAESNCTVSPNPGPLGMNVTVTCTTTAPSAVSPPVRQLPPGLPRSPGGNAVWMLALILGAFGWALVRRNQCGAGPWRPVALPIAAGLLLALALGGCGGGSTSGSGGPPPNPGTPAGSYPLTVKGTVSSGGAMSSHSVTLTLNVS